MSFNKRYIKREMIIDNINNLSFISSLVNSDGLIVDNWSNNFFKNFDFDFNTYQSKRLEMINNSTKQSGLKKLSNVFLNLKTNPTWVDISLVSEILNLPIDKNKKINELANIYIEKIEEKYG